MNKDTYDPHRRAISCCRGRRAFEGSGYWHLRSQRFLPSASARSLAVGGSGLFSKDIRTMHDLFVHTLQDSTKQKIRSRSRYRK
jgi:hypothetical protein